MKNEVGLSLPSLKPFMLPNSLCLFVCMGIGDKWASDGAAWEEEEEEAYTVGVEALLESLEVPPCCCEVYIRLYLAIINSSSTKLIDEVAATTAARAVPIIAMRVTLLEMSKYDQASALTHVSMEMSLLNIGK